MRSVPEWIAKHDDQAIPPRVKLRILVRCNFSCVECTRFLSSALPPQFDHIKALANGGEHRESNLQSLCFNCHAIKTGEDVAVKSKIYGQMLKTFGLKKAKRPFRAWRNFKGSIVRNPRLS